MFKNPGILAVQQISNLANDGYIKNIDEANLQPSSLDLSLCKTAYRVRASFLPGTTRKVDECLQHFTLHDFSLEQGAVLETGCVYIIPLKEELNLPNDINAATNPKSSTGRIDVFTRVISDYSQEFDIIKNGYKGRLYLEVAPRTFPIKVKSNSTLSQIRFSYKSQVLSDEEIVKILEKEKYIIDENIKIKDGINVSIDLKSEFSNDVIGYQARRHSDVLDIEGVAKHKIEDYWLPIKPNSHGNIILEPDQFYILASQEAVSIPPLYAAEMLPFDATKGEFRVHYAGFFDPGFGHTDGGGIGSRAVLEIRSHEVPFIIEHGQLVGRLIYFPLSERPEMIYGDDIGSNYQRQGLKLSKHFK